MSDLPHEWDFSTLEAEELSKPGSEFIQKPTKEQWEQARVNGLRRKLDATYAEMDFTQPATSNTLVDTGTLPIIRMGVRQAS